MRANRLEAAAGLRWIAEAFLIFRVAPVRQLLYGLAFLLALTVAMSVPLVGFALVWLLIPALVVGPHAIARAAAAPACSRARSCWSRDSGAILPRNCGSAASTLPACSPCLPPPSPADDGRFAQAMIGMARLDFDDLQQSRAAERDDDRRDVADGAAGGALVCAAAGGVEGNCDGQGGVLQRRGRTHQLARVPRLRRGNGAAVRAGADAGACRRDAVRRLGRPAGELGHVRRGLVAAAGVVCELLPQLPRRLRGARMPQAGSPPNHLQSRHEKLGAAGVFCRRGAGIHRRRERQGLAGKRAAGECRRGPTAAARPAAGVQPLRDQGDQPAGRAGGAARGGPVRRNRAGAALHQPRAADGRGREHGVRRHARALGRDAPWLPALPAGGDRGRTRHARRRPAWSASARSPTPA